VTLLLLLLACQPDDAELSQDEIVQTSDDAALHKIAYGSDGLRIEGHVAVPLGPGPHPIVLLNHGGFDGLAQMYRDEMLEHAADGFAVFASSYRGEDTSDGEVEYCSGEVTDVLNLLAVADAWDDVDTSRVFAGGFSHGACITLLLTMATDRLLGAVGMGSPGDVDALIQWHHDQGNHAFAEEWEGYVGEDGPSMSPLGQDLVAPILLLHGVEDPTVPLNQACDLLADHRSDWPTGSYRVAEEGTPVVGAAEDCQGELSGGHPWTDPALEDGLVLVTFEGVGHSPDGPMIETFWARAVAVLGSDGPGG